MGEEFDASLDYDRGNQFEREKTFQLNQEILGSNGKRSIVIPAPARLEIQPEQQARMQALIDGWQQRYVDWGFKDPRTTLVYPLWAKVLPQHKIIAIYRPVEELWLRYRPKSNFRRYRDFKIALNLIRRWCEHNARIVRYLGDTPMEHLLLEYRQLMETEQEFEHLQAFVGRPLIDKRQPSLYRHRTNKRSPVLRAAIWFHKLQGGQTPGEIITQLEQLHSLGFQPTNQTQAALIEG